MNLTKNKPNFILLLIIIFLFPIYILGNKNNEPLEKGHPFWKHPNVLVTPHIASLIDPVAGGKAIADNIKNFVLGNTINELIPPGKNY